MKRILKVLLHVYIKKGLSMTSNINRLINKLNIAEGDTQASLDVAFDLIELLLVQVDHLQTFAEENGLTSDDYLEYLERFDKRVLH
jgi:hypothetical protein